jgi:hypothetical protein
MHFRTASIDLPALKTAIDTNVTTGMWAGTSQLASVYQLALTPLDGTTATQLFAVTGAKWAGWGGTGDYLPAGAVVVSLRTAKRGRRARGRVFLPFVAELSQVNGALASAPTSNQTAWDAFRTGMATASMPLTVASYGHGLHKTKGTGGGYTMTPVTWPAEQNNVTSSIVETALGTMRPRQSRVR